MDAAASPLPWWHWARLREIEHRILDPAIAVLLAALCIVSTASGANVQVDATEPDALAYLLTVLGTAVLAVRTRAPMTAFGVCLVATVGFALRDYAENGLPLAAMVALYTVASRTPRDRSLLALTVTAAAIVGLTVNHSQGLDAAGAVANLAVFGIAYAGGRYVQVRRAYTEQLELRAADLEASRRREAEQAVAAERLRIARELHDVVAHAMSVVAVQSGVAAHVIEHRPDEARTMLEAINATSREALDEMRRMLGVLRSEADDGAGGELAPAPTLGDLRSLVASVEATGVDVGVEVVGEPTDLSPALDLTAFRIAQEALTNVVKHAGPAHVAVRLEYRPDEVVVEVTDDGRGAAAAPDVHESGGGHGLVGMRERVDLFGGSLEAGPRPGGGFRVRAILPSRSDLVAS